MVTVLEHVSRTVRASKPIIENYIGSSLRRLSEAGSVIERDQEVTDDIGLELDFIQVDIEIRMSAKEAYAPTLVYQRQSRKALIRTIERNNMK